MNLLNDEVYGSRWRKRLPQDRLPILVVIEDVPRRAGHLHVLVELPSENQDLHAEKVCNVLHGPACRTRIAVPPSSDVKVQLLRGDLAVKFYTAKRFHEDADWQAVYSSDEYYLGFGRQ